MATTATGRPARTRATTARKATPAKAAPKAAQAEPEASAETTEVESYVVDLEYTGDTAKYAKFVPPTGSGCVGTFYAPPGTKAVRVKISG